MGSFCLLSTSIEHVSKNTAQEGGHFPAPFGTFYGLQHRPAEHTTGKHQLLCAITPPLSAPAFDGLRPCVQNELHWLLPPLVQMEANTCCIAIHEA